MLENAIIIGIIVGVVITGIAIKVIRWYIKRKGQNQILVSEKAIEWDDKEGKWSEAK
jgi:hypothetical protein